jgi:hypothetical protein
VAKKRQRSGSYTIGQSTETTATVLQQGLQASRHAVAIELLKNALLLVEKASSLSPNSAYTSAKRALEHAIEGKPEAIAVFTAKPANQPAKPANQGRLAVEQQIQWLFNHFQKAKKALPETTKPTYSQAARKTTTTATVTPAPKPTATAKPTAKPMAKPTARPTAKATEFGQVILITQKDKQLPAFNIV